MTVEFINKELISPTQVLDRILGLASADLESLKVVDTECIQEIEQDFESGKSGYIDESQSSFFNDILSRCVYKHNYKIKSSSFIFNEDIDPEFIKKVRKFAIAEAPTISLDDVYDDSQGVFGVLLCKNALKASDYLCFKIFTLPALPKNGEDLTNILAGRNVLVSGDQIFAACLSIGVKKDLDNLKLAIECMEVNEMTPYLKIKKERQGLLTELTHLF